MMAPPNRSPEARRKIRRIRITGWTALSALLTTIVGFLVWAQTPYPEHPEPLRELYTRDDLTVESGPDWVVLTPATDSGALYGQALVFLPGARVNPHAYATSFADTVAGMGLSVVIPRPWWNLALTDPRGLEDFAPLVAPATITMVGGHSMGGVRACALADDPAISHLFLTASYCANALSQRSVEVLSLHGSRDELIDEQAIGDARALMPADYLEVTIEGASHASFGDYGPQSGDGVPTVTRDQAIAAISEQLDSWLTP